MAALSRIENKRLLRQCETEQFERDENCSGWKALRPIGGSRFGAYARGAVRREGGVIGGDDRPSWSRITPSRMSGNTLPGRRKMQLRWPLGALNG
jgi:hypothetical protein